MYHFFGRYSPTILLLRDFDVFTNSVSDEGSSSDQSSLSTAVASVIRKFTEPLAEDEGSYPEDQSDVDHVRCSCPSYLFINRIVCVFNLCFPPHHHPHYNGVPGTLLLGHFLY